MKGTDKEIVAGLGQHTVAGSYGTLLVDDETGMVLQYETVEGSGDAMQAYADIVRIDVLEYCEYNGGMDDTDITLVGFWTEKGDYVTPDYTDRKHRGPEITLRHRQKKALTAKEKAAKSVAMKKKGQ